MKPESTAAQREELRRGLESLRAIKSADTVFIGAPAPLAERGNRDSSYAFALTVLFKDVAAHEAYQIDPLHVGFIAAHRTLWSRVQVYDAL